VEIMGVTKSGLWWPQPHTMGGHARTFLLQKLKAKKHTLLISDPKLIPNLK